MISGASCFSAKCGSHGSTARLMERNPVLEKALRNGFRLENLIRPGPASASELAAISATWNATLRLRKNSFRRRFESRLGREENFFRMLLNPEDKLAGRLENALNWLEHPAEDGNELSKPGNAGAAKNWTGGKETVQATKEFLLRSAWNFRHLYKELPTQRLLHEVVCWIKDDFMMHEWEKRKQDGGLLDFDDQLRLARDLLLENKTVRREFQQQYQTLLVDEFQDTDPIQWEIVLLLSSADIEETDLAKLKPEPGRLFIVGDPKQSIYRFRNADIETYLGIVEAERLKSLGLDRLKLTTNFRSVPSILRFVDAAFGSAMKPAEDGCRYQPEYLAFGDHGDRKAESHAPAVHLLGDVNGESDAKPQNEGNCRKRSRTHRQAYPGDERFRSLEGPGRRRKKRRWLARASIWRYRRPAARSHACACAGGSVSGLRDSLCAGGREVLLRPQRSFFRYHWCCARLRIRTTASLSMARCGRFSSGCPMKTCCERTSTDCRWTIGKKCRGESPLYHPFEILRDLHRHRHERRASRNLRNSSAENRRAGSAGRARISVSGQSEQAGAHAARASGRRDLFPGCGFAGHDG